MSSDYSAHSLTLHRAQMVYEEKEKKYHGLWKNGGITDSAHHIRHKAARVTEILELPRSERLERADAAAEDAIDLINYSVFFLRNLSARRIGGLSNKMAALISELSDTDPEILKEAIAQLQPQQRERLRAAMFRSLGAIR